MRNKITLFALLLCLIVWGLSVNVSMADAHRGTKANSNREDGTNVVTDNHFVTPFPYVVLDTTGAVKGMTNFYDYRTNGQNPHGLWVLGDTVIVAADLVDSANASISTARKSYYQVSYNGGLTWQGDPLVVGPGNAYPDVNPVVVGGLRTVVMSGRQFVSGARRGYFATDAFLAGGSFTTTLLAGQECFTMPLANPFVAGGFESTSTDSLYFIKLDASSNTTSGKLFLAGASDGITANSRSYTAANVNGRVAIAWWDPAAGDMWVRTSTDNGATFAPKVHAISATQNLGGDICQSWLCADMVFSPTNNLCMAVSTLEQGALGTVRGSKLVFYSPAINSGNPVVIVDYHNAPSNSMMSDTTYYSNHYSSANQQVGMTAFSHPSIAYSNDGSRLFVVYSVTQKDTASYGFFFNDICESYSNDNGATWSAPVKITQTTDADEIYPIIAKTGCTASVIPVTWQLSSAPGSFSFTNTTTPEAKVYNIYKRINPLTGASVPIGIENISSNVPGKFSLMQNYPNPFNPSTKIRFALPKSANVTISIYNTVGQLVKTLANNEFVTAGTKEVTFDASNFASGIYFYSVKAGDFQDTKKMILIK